MSSLWCPSVSVKVSRPPGLHLRFLKDLKDFLDEFIQVEPLRAQIPQKWSSVRGLGVSEVQWSTVKYTYRIQRVHIQHCWSPVGCWPHSGMCRCLSCLTWWWLVLCPPRSFARCLAALLRLWTTTLVQDWYKQKHSTKNTHLTFNIICQTTIIILDKFSW